MSVEKLSAVLTVDLEKDQAEKELERLRSPKAIKMSMDVSDAKLQLEVLRKEYAAMDWAMKKSAVWKALWAQIQQQAREVTILWRNLTNFVRTWDKDVSMLWKMFQKLWLDINRWLWKSLTEATQQLAQFWAKWLALLWAWAIATGMLALWKQAIFLWDKLEQASLSFTVMLGSAEKAKTLLEDLTMFASKTPFELAWIRDSAKQLLAFGIDSESLIWTLKILGDTAAATGTPLEQIAYAYGQVRTAWQLYGSELRQFIQAGVPLLAELAKMYGVTEAQAKKMVEDWKVWFNDVQEAFKRMTSEWGKFFNMMETQSTTLTGKVSNLKDTFNSFLEEIGTALLPAAKFFVDLTSWMFQRFRDSFAGMQMITAILTWYVIDSWYSIKDTFVWVSTFLQKFAVMWKATWEQFGDNVYTLIENIGIAFDNMPAYIQAGLNKGLQLINWFVNKAAEWLNQVSEFFGAWKIAWNLNLQLDFAGPKKEYKAFSSAIIEASFSQIDALNATRAEYSKNMTAMKDINKVVLKEELTAIADSRNKKRELNMDLKKINEEKVDDEKKSWKKWVDAAAKAEKEKEKIMKENVQRQKKLFQDMKEKRAEELKNINDYIKKLKDALKDIADIEKEISNVWLDAQKQTIEEAWSRYRDLLERQKELQAGLAENPENAKELESVKKFIEELQNSGLMDQNTRAKEEQRASLDTQWQARFDFQDKLWQIAIDKANKQAELQAKKTEIENNLWLKKEQAEKELLIQEERKAKNERALKKYEEIISLIERWITDNTQKEIDKRMALYAQEEQRLLRLIELRMQAGYAVWAIAPAPVTNTVNNNPQVTVNANVANSVDVNTLANTLARKIQLSSKWIS